MEFMEKDIGKLRKNENTEIVVRIDDFGGKTGLTIREFVTSERYTGFTKSGVRIPAADFQRFKEMVNSIDEKDMEGTEEGSELPSDKPMPKEQTKLGSKDELPDY